MFRRRAVEARAIAFCLAGLSFLIGCGSNAAAPPATGCSDCWTTKASMSTARWGLATEQVNGILYAIGGQNGTGSPATVEAYAPSTNMWTTKAAMPTARGRLPVAAVKGLVDAAGAHDAA